MKLEATRLGPPRTAGAIALISCYELGHQPLNLASPAAHLRAAGFEPVLVDASIDDVDDALTPATRLVAISVPMHTALRLGTGIARRVRDAAPGAHICFFGLYATLNAAYLLRELGDSVIGGEYEAALTGLARALDAGEPPETVEGVGTRARPAPPLLSRPPAIVPDREGLPSLRRYAGLQRDGAIVRAGYVETTRGCRHTCGHCPITPVYGGRFVVVPREIVLADARRQIAAGARHLTFGDPDFFNGPSHGLRICRELAAEFPGLTFDATVKIEHLLEHRRRVPELAELGCAFVVSAVESLSDRVLGKLAKGHTRADVVTALDILDAAGLPMRPSLLPFTPWATLADYPDLLTFVAERDLQDHIDPVHLAIRLLVPPGSALLADPDAGEWLGALDESALTYLWSHADPRVDALQRAVARLVERAALDGTEPRETFAAIWETAHQLAGGAVPPLPEPTVRRSRPPRLTESWFC